MLLFDSYEGLFSFLMENIPEKTKYEYLYSTTYYNNNAPTSLTHAVFGRPKPPYYVFLDLLKHGYAYKFESRESNEKTFDGEKYILLWSRIESDISNNLFPSESTEHYKLISINEACKFLSLTRPSVYKLINENEIPVVQIFDSTKRIQMRDLLKYIEKKKTNPI